jgi:hypothetical protein
MVDFAYSIQAIRPKPYEFARQGLSPPSVNTIATRMHGEECYLHHALNATSGVSLNQYLQDYRTRCGIPAGVQIFAALAFDAIPVSSTGIGQPWIRGSHFTFIFLLVDDRYPNLSIHLIWHQNSKTCQEIQERRDMLLRIMKRTVS